VTRGRALEPPFAVGALAVLVFAIWFGKDAGFAPATWYTGGLFLVALAAVAFVAYGAASLSRAAVVALGCLGAFAAWSLLSIVWASDKGIAWDGANRTLLYFVVFALFVGLPWRRESIPVLIVALSLAALGIGLADLVRSASNPSAFFIIGRFAAPAGYPNAACALYVFGAWPLAYIAARREPSPLLRGAFLAGATALVELAVLTQSRGSIVAVPLAVVIYLLIVPFRLRAALAVAAVAVTVFLARAPLLAVFDPVRLGDASAGDKIHSTLAAIAVSAAIVFVAWSVLAFVDRRLELSPRFVRLANAGALGVAVVAVAVGAVAVSSVDLGAKWRHFKAGYPEESGGSHFSIGLGSNRYDFWRVAAGEFRHHPLQGVGADNFAADYVRERRSSEEPLYPHSLALRVPAQTGIVGTLLFAGFLVSAALAVTRGAGFSDGVARAGVAAAAYYAIHGSGDWLWEFAGLGAPAFAWVGLAASRPAAASERSRVFRAAVVAGAAAVALSFVFPWLAELEAQRALHVWARNPQSAFRELDRARTLNPLSTRPDLLAGVIASRKNDVPRMASAFEAAIDRDSRNWYAHLELAMAYAALHQRNKALTQLAVSRRLNPGEEAVGIVRGRVTAGRPVNRNQIDRLFVERVRSRVGP
jgi:O-antigen ligase/polysaccharide polymerase Wzy-like membrane protein